MHFHGDAIVDWANQLAQITTHTFFFFDGVIVIWISSFDIDGLVRSVFTSDETQATVDAFVLIDVGNVMVIDIEIFPMRDFLDGFSDEVGSFLIAFFVHPIVESFTHIFHYSEAVGHRCSTNWNRSGTEKHKLDGVFPCTYASNSRNWNS